MNQHVFDAYFFNLSSLVSAKSSFCPPADIYLTLHNLISTFLKRISYVEMF